MVTTSDQHRHRPQSGNGSVSQGANLTADWEHKHWFDVASSQWDDGFPEGFLLIRRGGIIISETEKARTFFKTFLTLGTGSGNRNIGLVVAAFWFPTADAVSTAVWT